MSTLETVNRGFEAVATTVMRYRCSVEDTAALWGGCPGGTKTTSSRSNTRWTSLAATRCPWWIGSKVPPMTPRRRRRPSGVLAAGSEDEQPEQDDGQQHEDADAHEPGAQAAGRGLQDDVRVRHGRHPTVSSRGSLR